jgi:DNA polymerase III epsilon subunit-like protein
VKKLVPFANSQRNESFNNIVSSKNPKTHFYGGSKSNDYRVACAVTQKNIGYLYVSRTLQALGIDPGENCIAHGIVMDKKLASDMVRKSKKEFKVRRHQLQTQRLSKNTKREAKEGQTYQTGIGLNLDTSGKKESKKQTKGTLTVLGVDPSKITMEERLEFEKLVPRFTQRPTRLSQRFDSSVAYNFIFFDLETTATGRTAEICQLSAKSQNGNALSKYILPARDISPGASRVNDLTVQYIHGERVLCKNAYPVNSVSLGDALSFFVEYIRCCINTVVVPNSKTILLGHNSSTFDIPTLFRSSDNSFKDQLTEMNVYIGDTLPLTRSLIKNKHASLKQENGEFCKANLCSLYECLFKKEFAAHDALISTPKH